MLNLLYRIVSALRKIYWRILRPTTIGVKAIIECEKQILLIKNRYDNFWYLPGGKVKSGENPTDSIKRELREECGIKMGEANLFGVYLNRAEYKNDYIILFASQFKTCPLIKNGLEIEASGFYDLDSLPDKISAATLRRLSEYHGKNSISGQW